MIEKEIKQALQNKADPHYAQRLQTYFKTGKGDYAEHDVFIGLRMPQIRNTVKKYQNDITVENCTKLLQSDIHEIRMAAVLLLVALFKKGDKAKKEKVYEVYIKNSNRINNWDLVDVSTPHIVGEYLVSNPEKISEVQNLVNAKNIWKRRIAVLAGFAFIRNNKFSYSKKVAVLLIDDSHDLIHKAVGWMLREIGKRDQKELVDFLGKYYQDMPRTMLRYAIERLPEELRQTFLKGTFIYVDDK